MLGMLTSASYLSDGQIVDVPGEDLMDHAQPYFISPAFAFVAYPNRNSVPFKEFYNIPEAETVVRGSLRYQGFPEIVKVLVKLGWLDLTQKAWLKGSLTWAQITQKVLGAAEPTESCLIACIKAAYQFSSEEESSRIISGLKWIGLFSGNTIVPRNGNLLDTLCAQLETLLMYDQGERDFIMLQHKFHIEWEDGRKEIRTSTLEIYGNPIGHSAMASTVGLPCGIATQLILDGVFNTPGVLTPYTKEICDPIRKILETEGISLVERVL